MLPNTLALTEPASPKITREKQEILRVKSSLVENQIDLSGFIHLSDSLSKVFAISEKLAIQSDIIHNIKAPEIIYISLQSPLEIIFILAAGLPPALLKFISWYKDIVLKNLEIKKAELEILHKEAELETKRIEQNLQLIEFQKRIQNELPSISKEDAQKFVVHLHNHIALVKSSDTFRNYEISTEQETEVIKSDAKSISPSHVQQQLDESK